MPIIKEIKKFARSRLRPARKGETGYKERRVVLKHPKNAMEAALSFSRRAFQQVKQFGGRTLEKAAAERRKTAPPETIAKLDMAVFKKRRSFEKKAEYKDELIKDIRWFERFKVLRMERHIGVHGIEVGGAHTQEDYARGKAFAEKHRDVEEDFLKYVSSPPKKKAPRRRKLDAKGRSIKDMMRSARRGAPKKRAA